MTTLSNETVTCALCGTDSSHTAVTSTNTLGWSDLDFRPAEMQRRTMRFWVQECPRCGYVGSHLSAAVPGTQAVVDTPEYRNLKDDKSLPPLASCFLRQSLIQERLGQTEAAADTALCAAWDADDNGRTELARAARSTATRLFERVLAGPDMADEPRLALQVRLIDVSRRCGEWDQAHKRCSTLMAETLEPTLVVIVKFQMGLIAVRDAACYTVGDATEGSRHP